MDDKELSDRVQRAATRYQASDRLRASVVTQIALNVASRDEHVPKRTTVLGWWSGVGVNRGSLGAGFALGMVLTLALVWGSVHLQGTISPQGELVALHVRSLGAGPLYEVASSDRHTVKPWFQGKLDYAPEVVDVSSGGFPMVGGRVDTLQGRPTAALVYTARKHFINVFERPSDGVGEFEISGHKGFHIVAWRDGTMQVWAVSDVESAELERFAKAWRIATSGR